MYYCVGYYIYLHLIVYMYYDGYSYLRRVMTRL